MENLSDVYNRQHYFTHKYRGNLLTDINVGVGLADNGSDKTIQIFVRHKKLYIRENIIYNSNGLFKTVIKTNLHGED